jgi:hypothetical protein
MFVRVPFEKEWRFEILRALDCLQVCEVLGGPSVKPFGGRRHGRGQFKRGGYRHGARAEP